MGNATINDLLRALAEQGLMVAGDDVMGAATKTDEISLEDIARPEAFARRYPDVVGSPSRLRYLLRHREHNGLTKSGAVVERGRAIYIVKPRFLYWLIGGRA